MDERSFIDEKRPSWEHLAESIEQIRRLGPGSLARDRLASLGAEYRAAVSDLSFARSQGASENLISYLNELAGRTHGVLYASQSARAKGAVAFLLREFPQLFRSTFRYTLVAAMIFFIGWGIGDYIIRSDPGFGNAVLRQKIAKKSKGKVLNEVPDPAAMSSFIMTNNIKVGIYAFSAGVTAGVLTTAVLFSNGLMIGQVAGMAIPEMGHVTFWSFILPHGVIELTAIFICGGAGLMIGSAMIAPGNLRRGDAIRTAAEKALRLFAGALLFFVVAGLIEGFLTPSVIPQWSKLAFAGLTGIALIAYLGFAGSAVHGE